jgi:hypothetical protein
MTQRPPRDPKTPTAIGVLKANPWWSGEADWPHGPSRIGLMIFGSPLGPTDEDRGAFAGIRDAYPELLPKISRAVFSLWEAAPPTARDPAFHPASPAELMALLHLECICFDRSAMVELLYEGNVGMFTVGIENENVQPKAFQGAGAQRP